MTDINATLNSTDCVHMMTGLGSNIVYNVCTGTQQIMAWGALDWIAYTFAAIICIALSAAVVFGLVLGVRAAIWHLW